MTNYFDQDIGITLARSAHAGTSFDPDRRAESHRTEYNATLAQDYESMRQNAERGGTLGLLDAEFARYRTAYARRYLAYLSSSARCVSWMIAGPSNFPVARMRKRSEIANKRCEDLIEFRKRALASINRTLRPDLAPIMAGDADAKTRLQAELDALEKQQTRMKQVNAIIRKFAKQGADAQIKALADLGYSDHIASQLLKPDFAGRIGFADYKITNNGANIRRIKQRIAEVEARADWQSKETQADSGVTIREDVESNRLMLIFPGKPDDATRNKLKQHGFRWSPSNGAWQRFLNESSRYAAKQVLMP